MSTQISSIWPIDRVLSGTSIPGQSGPGSDSNERVHHIPQTSSSTGISPSDCLVSYTGLPLGGLTPMQMCPWCTLQPQPTEQFSQILLRPGIFSHQEKTIILMNSRSFQTELFDPSRWPMNLLKWTCSWPAIALIHLAVYPSAASNFPILHACVIRIEFPTVRIG